MFKEFEPNANQIFQVGDTISCPSDLTGIKWKITTIDKKGVIHAEVLEGQTPSEYYPRKIEIQVQSYSDWMRVD